MTATLEGAPPIARPVARATTRRPGPWWRDAAGAAAIATVIVVLALWTGHGGVQALGAADHGLTALGRLTGLLSADLMLLQVLLMARVPWIERAYGQDRLARKHRLFGFWSFWLLTAHIALITLGYAATTRTGVLAQAWRLVTTYPGMLRPRRRPGSSSPWW
ncbi:ferric reductase-like transmembrane domain-containing protein [Luedemannella flava]